MRKKFYQNQKHNDSRKLAEFLAKDGQLLLPMLELICNTENAIDELIDITGRAAIEAVLLMSAKEVAGEKHPGKLGSEIGWHGRQSGVVALSDRKIRVEKPRLRKKGKGSGKEVEIPAYQMMLENTNLGQRMLEILMLGVSTRKYKEVVPAMAETVGVSKSQVSRKFIEASGEELKHICERDFADKDILAIYIDGIQFGQTHVIIALGVDSEGHKHILGLQEGSSENSKIVIDLLNGLVDRGIKNDRLRLFIIDGSKALRCGIDSVYGSENPVQRCRIHKIRNVLSYLPEDPRSQVESTMKAAYQLSAKEGKKKLEKLAEWLQNEHPSAAGSLLEGLDETFTINRLELPDQLRRCLGTTNVIESPNSGIRSRTRRVKKWKDSRMVVRWVAASLLDMEKNFHRIMGFKHLWILDTKLRKLNGEDLVVDTEAAVA